jgi:hypothetical protein
MRPETMDKPEPSPPPLAGGCRGRSAGRGEAPRPADRAARRAAPRCARGGRSPVIGCPPISSVTGSQLSASKGKAGTLAWRRVGHSLSTSLPALRGGCRTRLEARPDRESPSTPDCEVVRPSPTTTPASRDKSPVNTAIYLAARMRNSGAPLRAGNSPQNEYNSCT